MEKQEWVRFALSSSYKIFVLLSTI